MELPLSKNTLGLWEDEPVWSLLDQPLDTMTEEQLRSFVLHLRQIRTSPTTLRAKIVKEKKPKTLSATKIQQDAILNSLLQ